MIRITQNRYNRYIDHLSKHSSSPRLDLNIFIEEITGINRAKIIADYQSIKLNLKQYFKLIHYIKLRHEGMPVAYILKKKCFYNNEFYVNKNVLIPRPETENMVEVFIDYIEHYKEISYKKSYLEVNGATSRDVAKLYRLNHEIGHFEDELNICEIGVGSGAVLLSILEESIKKDIKAKYYGIDISKKALEVAKQNEKKIFNKKIVNWVNSDLLDNFNKDIKFDFILSNPPYISKQDYNKLPINVSKYEPRLALYGGIDGNDTYKKIISQSKKYLYKNGFLILEIGDDYQAIEISKILQDNDFGIRVFNDLSGVARVICGQKLI